MRSPARVSMLTIAQIALCSQEGVAGSCVRAADDAEWQVKQGVHFSLPIANQASRWDDEHATDESAG